MFLKLRISFSQRIMRWVVRRIPPSAAKTLSHREIFVLPTRWGCLFALMIILILVTGINYQNSMILAVGLFLVSVVVLSIVSTYRNLAGLSVAFHRGQPCFAGELAGFEFIVSSGKLQYTAVEIGWVPDQFTIVDVPAKERSDVFIECKAPQRGYFRPGRLLITSTYPFGLVRAWSWQDLKAESLVYPAPLKGELVSGSLESDTAKEGKRSPLLGQDDFSGLKTFVPGESLNRVAWKKFAQTGEFYSKEFTQPSVDPEWVDFSAFQIADIELRLSYMCGQLLELHGRGGLYGLRMPGLSLSPQNSPVHLNKCLEALAMYPDHVTKTI